jgi:hypothetical protein
MICSKYFSDDGRAEAVVSLTGTYAINVSGYVDGRLVASINTFDDIDAAEDFAEDFVRDNKKNNGQQNNQQLEVLYRIAEPNERDRQPCMG